MTILNTQATSGQFGQTRVLPTMTIHQHDNGTFFVTDDWNSDKLLSAGHATAADAVKMHRGRSDRRLQNKA